MSMNTLLMIGALVGGVAAILMRCKVEFLQPLCDAWPEGESPLDDIIAQFNKKSTSPKGTSDYRSVTMDKEDPKVVSKRIQDQSNLSVPATKKAAAYIKPANTQANLNTFCTAANKKLYPNVCVSAKYANSLFTTARLAI